MERPVLLCGLGRVGWRVLESLRGAGLPVVVIDLKTEPEDPRLGEARAFKGDCRRHELLEQAGIRNARGVVIVTSDDLVNISTALLARKLNPTARIVVRMFNQNLITRFGGAVKNTVALSVSALIAPVMALTAVTGDALGAFRLEDGPRQISELLVATDSELAGERIADLAFKHNFVPLVLVPASGSPVFLQALSGDRVLSPGDKLVVAGRPGLTRNASVVLACSARSVSALNAFAMAAVRCSPPRRIVRAAIGSPARTKQTFVRVWPKSSTATHGAAPFAGASAAIGSSVR